MLGNALPHKAQQIIAKNATTHPFVSKFMEVYDVESDGVKNGLIGGESRVGLVSFSATATIDSQLTNSTKIPIQKINGMKAQGATNHEDAFLKAIDV